MEKENPLNNHDEIDILNLFCLFWANKLFILLIMLISILLGGIYSANVVNKFTASAIFTLGEQQSPMPAKDTLGVYSNLLGISQDNTKFASITEKVMSRIYIESLDKNLDFQSDPFYNSYNQSLIEPKWKKTLKSFIGWPPSAPTPIENMWQTIINNFVNNVSFKKTKSDAFILKVIHEDPHRAAEIANFIMNKILADDKKYRNAVRDNQINYLSKKLAGALNDLDKSQSKIKRFTIENSALPMQEFAAGSLQLDKLREDLTKTSLLYEAVSELRLIFQKKEILNKDYVNLRNRFPIVDQVEFRRILGQSEIVSSWTWPDHTTVEAVMETLGERKEMLSYRINVAQKDAEKSSILLNEFAKLEREVKISEATYQVLIEQVKSNELLSGYMPDNSEIYEYAAPPAAVSTPNRKLILIIATLSGFFVGCGLSSLTLIWRKVYYSKRLLIERSNAYFNINSKFLYFAKRKKFSQIRNKKSITALRDLAVEIHKNRSTNVIITSLQAKLISSEIAFALASYIHTNNLKMKIGVIDFSARDTKTKSVNESESIGSYVLFDQLDNISILAPILEKEAANFLSHVDFTNSLKVLNSNFDFLFLCADNSEAITLLRATEGIDFFHIMSARAGHSRSNDLSEMISLAPIQGLLYG
jgi:uncharacterized protein involved in exopolysaccharide biosynthesis